MLFFLRLVSLAYMNYFNVLIALLRALEFPTHTWLMLISGSIVGIPAFSSPFYHISIFPNKQKKKNLWPILGSGRLLCFVSTGVYLWQPVSSLCMCVHAKYVCVFNSLITFCCEDCIYKYSLGSVCKLLSSTGKVFLCCLHANWRYHFKTKFQVEVLGTKCCKHVWSLAYGYEFLMAIIFPLSSRFQGWNL